MYAILGCLSGFLSDLKKEIYYICSFDIIAAINSFIEFIVVVNYVKTIAATAAYVD